MAANPGGTQVMIRMTPENWLSGLWQGRRLSSGRRLTAGAAHGRASVRSLMASLIASKLTWMRLMVLGGKRVNSPW